ncbi:fumarylacetoacetate hydrolase family protein [Microbacterium sp.]|uniref:fumarylacetoacetate hydrolase family protein n=1 Tax=Microbacterium sp. TaxID=51671 RepID=UPI003567C572
MSGVRVASLKGRLHLLVDQLAIDVEEASDGRFGPDPQSAFDHWADFTEWMSTVRVDDSVATSYLASDLDTPISRPPQIFAIGLNYADHAAESKMTLPEHPVVFTKFASSLTGADVEVALSGERVDWEAELVVVIGEAGRDIPVERAWDHVAGLAVGQDLSDRAVQTRGNPAQFSLGKSFKGYAPVGPVTPLSQLPSASDRDALAIKCVLEEADGTSRTLQEGSSADMVFSISEIIHRLSTTVEFRPGDLIFTGTPSGVGIGRDPQEFLRAGQVLTTEIEGLGSITQRMI